ncbi:cupin [Duganella sp. FT92W]|uniref:Cupin n=1 Tax=Pseudoduganella rivuli TaxID=2666085 RepID=A0A7X2ITC6_9BURK|nr:cupin domain-containing protein [Pseudoduganella rivuli]MRV75669.1 cupin [Pseudoduganella rivuli]
MEIIHRIEQAEWHRPAGFDPGIDQFIVADTLDQERKTGMRTRFVRFAPGAATKVPFIHDYDEEVYLVEGDQNLLDKNLLQEIKQYQQGAYFVRPAGTYHGPFSSTDGCLLLEIHSYPA